MRHRTRASWHDLDSETAHLEGSSICQAGAVSSLSFFPTGKCKVMVQAWLGSSLWLFWEGGSSRAAVPIEALWWATPGLLPGSSCVIHAPVSWNVNAATR